MNLTMKFQIAASTRAPTVLLVEGDYDHVERLAPEIEREQKTDIFVATNVIEAVEQIGALTQINTLVLDCDLPCNDCLTIAAVFQEHFPMGKVVCASRLGRERLKGNLASLARHVESVCLPRPYSFSSLLLALSQSGMFQNLNSKRDSING